MEIRAWPYGYGVLRYSVLALTTLVTTFTTVLVVGCGDERPPVSDDAVVGSDDAPLIGRTGDGDRLGPVICEPFSRRSCVVVYYDEHGKRICQPTFRVCRHDGRLWTACGELDGGTPAPASEEDAGSDDTSDSAAPEDDLR